MSFEFYALPTELKREVFNINKPKYDYENFVKSFNKQVLEMKDLLEDIGGGCDMEFEGHGVWVDVFLNGGYEMALIPGEYGLGEHFKPETTPQFQALVDANARGVVQHYAHEWDEGDSEIHEE
jgi:hypothetical protein